MDEVTIMLSPEPIYGLFQNDSLWNRWESLVIDKWDEVENVIGMTWVDNEYPQNAYPIGAGKCDEYTILR